MYSYIKHPKGYCSALIFISHWAIIFKPIPIGYDLISSLVIETRFRELTAKASINRKRSYLFFYPAVLAVWK